MMTTRMRKKRRLTAEINVVPYIDVMLVLLIIFMVTAPMLKTGVNVNLPDAPAKPVKNEQDNKPIIVTVKKNGQMYLNVAPKPEQPLPSTQITAIASKIIQSRPKAPVSVKGDGAGTYANVVRAMVALQQAGASNIGLQTDNISPPQDSDSGDNSGGGNTDDRGN